jgi:prophage antirepressor-like protein
MKSFSILTLFIVLFATVTTAQVKETVLKSISDDGKTMKVKLTVALHDASLNYDKKFDVSNMSKAEKDQLIDRIIDSLGARKYFPSGRTNSSLTTGIKANIGNDDRKAVERAILNYVEGVYEADTAKIYESVAPFLAKRGYFMRNNELRDAPMTFAQLVAVTKSWSQNQKITAETPKKVTVFDILDKTASGKVEAKWGIDYFHLAKVNGKWTIVNVLWQDYPAK